jgi:hypothetical protein
VHKGIIKDYKVVVKFSLVINNICLKVKVSVKGGGDVISLIINLVVMPLDMVNKAI